MSQAATGGAHVAPVNEIGNESEQAPSQQTGAMILRELFEKKKGAVQAVCTPHLGAERLFKLIGAAAARTPKLLQCTPASLLDAAMKMAEIGLSPGPLGEVYLIPYENKRAGTIECQLIIGYRGLVTLARRSGQIATIAAVVVRESDEFTLAYTTDGVDFRHTPKLPLTGKVIGVWAMARFKDGANQFDFMDRVEVDAIKNRSRAGNSGPWVSDYNEMSKKTVLRRLCKLLPLTPEIESALATADRTEFDFEAESAAAAQVSPLAAAIDQLGKAAAPTPKPADTTAPAVSSPQASPAIETRRPGDAGNAPGKQDDPPFDPSEIAAGMDEGRRDTGRVLSQRPKLPVTEDPNF